MTTSAYVLIIALLVLIVVVSIVFFPRSETTPPLNTGGGDQQQQAAQPPDNRSYQPEPYYPPNDTQDSRTTTGVVDLGEGAARREVVTTGDVTDRRTDTAGGVSGLPAQHVIKQGDTYTSLAMKYYGCSERDAYPFTRLISRANPGVDERRLRLNATIVIPALTPELAARLSGTTTAATHTDVTAVRTGDSTDTTATSRTTTATDTTVRTGGQDLSAYRTYTVKRNDSLWEIARLQLGDATKHQELFELNKRLGLMQTPTDLKQGQVIVLGLR